MVAVTGDQVTNRGCGKGKGWRRHGPIVGYGVQDIIGWVPVRWKGHRGSEPGIRRANIVQVSGKAIRENITSKGRGRVRSTRIGIACVCARSLPGIGRKRGRERKWIGATPEADVLVTLGMKSCPLVNSPKATRATQQLGGSVLSGCKGVCLLNCRDLPSQRSPSIADHALTWGNFCLRVSANLSIARNCAGSSSCKMALSWVLTSSRSDTSWVANQNCVAVLIVSPEMMGGSCWARQSHQIYLNIRDTAYCMAHSMPCRYQLDIAS